MGSEPGRAGVSICDADLEDELSRGLGPARVERIVAAEGELGRLPPLDGVLAHVQ